MSASEHDDFIASLVQKATVLLMCELLTGGVIIGFVLGYLVFR